jgi:preprotein translocase subunit SecG
MKIRPTGTAYFLMAIFIVLVVFLMVSLTYDQYKTKFMPVLVSAITLILTVVALIQEFKGAGKTDSKEKQEEEIKHKRANVPLSRFLNAFGWFLSLIIGVYVFGFFMAIPLWIFVYLWRHGHRWWSALLQGAGAVLVVYLVFVVLLQVDFYPGLIW